MQTERRQGACRRDGGGGSADVVYTKPFLGAMSVIVILSLLLGARRLHLVEQLGTPDRVFQTNARREGMLSKSMPEAQQTSQPRGEAATNARQIVAEKLGQFARSRRAFARALAKRHGEPVPDCVDRFFSAVESGDWDKIEKAFNEINGGDSSASQHERPPGVAKLWPAIVDAYGAAEQVHLWPAQELLDYGNSVLGALRPGMVYVGGTDEGRWVPELLNDTSGGERHIIITQNGLAAADYQEYLRLQYDGQFANLSDEESQQAFETYVSDARARLEHDQKFPNEPRQLRPGEDVQLVDGKAQVGGIVAVMGINEVLLQNLIQKNSGLSFALEESFPMKSTYANATPLGPLMELGAANQGNPFTAEQATDNLNYWRGITRQVLEDPEASISETTLRSYSHNTVASANLMAAHGYSGEAEQAYALGSQLWPGNPEPVNGVADLLIARGREQEARDLLDNFSRNYPGQQQALARGSAAWTLSWIPAGTGK